jgi:hypothetical protein
MKSPAEILQANAETYREKEDDYGESWKLAGKTLALWLNHNGLDELVLDADADTLNSLGLFTRRLDKMIRAFNGEFMADDLNFESVADSHEDESTYAAMHASLLAEQEPTEFVNSGVDPLEEIETTVTINPQDDEDDEWEAPAYLRER